MLTSLVFPPLLFAALMETHAVSRTAVSGALDGSRAVLCVLGVEDSHPGAAPLSACHNPRHTLGPCCCCCSAPLPPV
uniref:Secreted protein n=1 Tax=Aquila chrysaetos chrysaetos TaxID=223781 RepID=A0A663FJN3_AQUCH